MNTRALLLLLILLIGQFSSPRPARAQTGVAAVIQAGVKKVIKAIDLKVQRLQNQTIWLQSAQKTLENAMSKLHLKEIADWTEKQKTLYGDYFQELRQVKSAISRYRRLREAGQTQLRLVSAYRQAWALLSKDTNFSAEELGHMQQVYSGMLQTSLQQLDQLLLLGSDFKTQMSDAQRIALLSQAAADMENTCRDLESFSRENKLLSLSRTKDQKDLERSRLIYGL